MERVDLAVAGGGVIGLASAWRCALAGASVAVVDPFFAGKRPQPLPASLAAAGMLAPVTEAHYGEEDLVELNLRSAELWPAFVGELETASGTEVGYRREGTLAVAFDAGDRAALEDLHRFQRSLGLDSTWLGPLACRSLEPVLAPSTRGGLLVPGDHQVDPRRLVAALIAACRASGVRLVAAAVSEILVSGGTCGASSGGASAGGLRLTDGTDIVSSSTLLACGWRSGGIAGLPEHARPPVRPVKGQILRLRASPQVRLPSHNLRAIVQASSIYVVPRRDGEVVVGATVEEKGEDAEVTAGGVYTLLRDARLLVPGLDEATLAECAVGQRPGSPDNRPLIGEGGIDGLVVATGHYRNGIHLTPVTAEIVKSLVCGPGAPQWASPFDPRRFARASLGRS
ncbi:MAG: glycine oxidase ThiO [Acidimicrobiales bacterium]